MGYAPSGVLISKKKFDKLPPSYQNTVKKIGEECLQELVELIQKDNLKAHKVLEKNNVKWVSLPGEKEKVRFQEAGARARKKLAGKYFPAELLDEVLNHLKEFRH
jgi:TRAP-type C4-dicarboxylate transport system substrate-binding protein